MESGTLLPLPKAYVGLLCLALEVMLWKTSVLAFCVGKSVCANVCALLISPVGQTPLQSTELGWRVVGGRALTPSIPFCLYSQECWETICSIVPPGIFSCALSSLAVSNSSDRHPALPWEAKYSSAITIGRRMRFQGNEGNLLENSSNVKGLLDFAVRLCS